MEFGLLLMPIAGPSRNAPEILRHCREMVVMADRLGMTEAWDLQWQDKRQLAIADPLQFFASTVPVIRNIAFGVQCERATPEQMQQFQALSAGRLTRTAGCDESAVTLRVTDTACMTADSTVDPVPTGRLLPPWLEGDTLAGHAASHRTEVGSEWRLARSILVAETDEMARSYLAEPGCAWRNDLGLSQGEADQIIIAGRPETVATRLQRIIETLGVPVSTLLMTQIEWDRPSFHRKSFELFSTEVMPRLRRHFETVRTAGRRP